MAMDDKKAVHPAISEAERRRRQAACDYARASVGLEGSKPSQADEEHAARLIAGEINLAEFVAPRSR
ncbi:MAG: hypothetical protein E5299_02178 [Burkholderia gladioli]|nr:MAG: hypothetical protein E5299_02178 [Burkholderia gladioli]